MKRQVLKLRETNIVEIENGLVYINPLPELRSVVADLYPILEDTIIPEEALNPSIWKIPEGYYAVISKD
mgnify:CR=1 FL=1